MNLQNQIKEFKKGKEKKIGKVPDAWASIQSTAQRKDDH